jgi:RTX calcium-binding nonapeptide repeat (4 copies)
MPLYATIEGGDDNDTISYDGGPTNFSSPTIVGGAGDDLITFGSWSGYEVRAEGGEGSDTIDASSATSGRYSGGDGNDFIVTARGGLSGEGYVNSAEGGDGDDTHPL